MVSPLNVEFIVDAVLLCVEKVKLMDREFLSWCHDISSVMKSGVCMVRIVSYGYAIKKNGLIVGFTAVSSLSGLDENMLSPVSTKIIFSDGKIVEVRPEVELHRCLKELCPQVRIYRF